MAIKLHHLNDSRSMRILWLLEEAQLPYQLVRYRRNPTTQLAPEELKAIHPLGKSPVVEIDGKVIVESGAIVEYIIGKYAPHLAPDAQEACYVDYLQWIHFAESSAMLPVLLKVFNQFEKQNGQTLQFLDAYAETEFRKVFAYLDDYLASREFIVGQRLTGADFMLGFVVKLVTERFNLGLQYPNILRYATRLSDTPSWQKAQRLESTPA
ncbi:Disulfide-bond oxidoreductase YfcG [Dickeya dianthicola]|uniref:glutathione transferase n=1 Tax=Dickeya dianthicola TaxID=204039 RepID=A0AAP2D272_9GAMM|nr:glutathione S-transferase [Dickeya dianthicola]ATO33922.1 Glutathione S-transferase [Dickeya dianthicola RNS04.9]AYC19885.1 Disulfide-bond oxidoreductase YfcG [Dickeya dianthicola]MBI0436378.1 glutathione S-transferase [Dickeya dianthicola]MBI0447438.1 glutathione S-transferase [Dickeya dianthicola]MBI0451813.1 glutathione S-transferase [Dickeya dianthicola]